MLNQIKAELFKLLKSKVTYLLAITLLVPAIFGVGMYVQLPFLVFENTDNMEFFSKTDFSALEFAINMVGQIHYVTIFLFLIISSVVLAKEIEQGQIRLYVIRVGKRYQIILSKFIAITMMQAIYYCMFIVFSFACYYLLVAESRYGSGEFSGGNAALYLTSFGVRLLGVAAITSINLAVCTKLKTFAAFAATFIFWFTTLYLSFFDNLKMIVPDNLAAEILSELNESISLIPYVGLYGAYIFTTLLISILIFSRKNLN
jgi:ABC-type transport system involved in multi-copper enzyme maturation permease subunit